MTSTEAKPRKLNIEGEEQVTTSDQFLELESLPRRIIFIGGGYISMEFAHVSLRADREVAILHRRKRLLEGFDLDLVEQLLAKTRKLGATVELEAEVKAVEKRNLGVTVHAHVAGSEKTFDADLVVHGAGRVPDIEDLNLAEAKVETEKRGIRVNEYLQSVSNPAVYAAGDAAASGGPPLTPVAGYEGRIVAANLLKGNDLKGKIRGNPNRGVYDSSLGFRWLLRALGSEKGHQVPHDSRDYQFLVFVTQSCGGLLGLQGLDRRGKRPDFGCPPTWPSC